MPRRKIPFGPYRLTTTHAGFAPSVQGEIMIDPNGASTVAAIGLQMIRKKCRRNAGAVCSISLIRITTPKDAPRGLHGQFVPGGGTFERADGDIDLTYTSVRKYASASVAAFSRTVISIHACWASTRTTSPPVLCLPRTPANFRIAAACWAHSLSGRRSL